MSAHLRRVLAPYGLAIAALLLLAAASAGCGAGGSSTSEGGGDPQAGGTFHLAQSGEVITLDPPEVLEEQSAHVVGQIMEPLFKTNSAGKVEPWLASSYRQSQDHLTWTFSLRKGVRFSNGDPLTGSDVVFSLDRVRKSASWSFLYESISEVSAPSASTVVIKTSKPMPGLPTVLSLFAADIIPKDFGGVTEKEFASHPIGTGPLKFVSWDRGSALTLERNTAYWESDRPLLQQLVFVSAGEDNSRVAQLKTGGLNAIESPPSSQADLLESTPGLKVETYAEGRCDLLWINARDPLFRDRRVREAIDLGIDREGIVKTALSGRGSPAGSWFPPSLEFHDASIKPPRQDVAKARQLLAEALQESSLKPQFTLLIRAGETYNSTVGQMIEQELDEVGFDVKVESLDEAAAVERAFGGEFDATIGPIESDIVEPQELVDFYVSTDAFGSGAPTAKIAQLSEEAQTTVDEAARGGLYEQIQRITDREMFLLPLDYQPFIWAMQGDVAKFEVNATSLPWLANAGFTG